MDLLEQLSRIASPGTLTDDGVPSASVAILEDGKISALNITNGKENTETVYQACSISKAITALAVAKLIDQGRLSYNTKVVEHLPQSTIDCIVGPKTAHLIQHVTIGMLLSHTSGLSQTGFAGYVDEPPSTENTLSGKAPSNTPRVRFDTFPGAQFNYSGGGFVVLQVFLECFTGLGFPDFMNETVLKPLGMSRSHYGQLLPEEQNYSKAHVTAYTEANATYHKFTELAAGGLWSTPTDLLKAISAVQESLHTDSGFLTQDTARKMLTRVPQAPDTMSMALGWGSDASFFAHAGLNFPGYNCYAFGSHGGVVNTSGGSSAGVPPRNGMAIMTGSSLGHESIRKMLSAVFYLKGWPKFEMLPCYGFSQKDWVPYAVADDGVVDQNWREWIGKWGDEWRLLDCEGPCLAFRDMEPMRLKLAAAPVEVFDDGKRGHELVADGVNVGLRLTWSGNERVLELILEPGEVKLLYRKYID